MFATNAVAVGAIKSDAHELGDASNYAGSARLALLAHPKARQALHSRITFNRTQRELHFSLSHLISGKLLVFSISTPYEPSPHRFHQSRLPKSIS